MEGCGKDNTLFNINMQNCERLKMIGYTYFYDFLGSSYAEEILLVEFSIKFLQQRELCVA